MNVFARLFVIVLLALFSLAATAQTVDINTATAAEIAEALQGVGPKKSAAIVEYRERHGPFASVDDITKVHGIGSKTLEKNRAMISVGDLDEAVDAAKDTAMDKAQAEATKAAGQAMDKATATVNP